MEKLLMTRLQSNFLARIVAAFESSNHLNLLLDFYPGGELFYHLGKIKLSENESKIYFCQILLALEYLH